MCGMAWWSNGRHLPPKRMYIYVRNVGRKSLLLPRWGVGAASAEYAPDALGIRALFTHLRDEDYRLPRPSGVYQERPRVISGR